MELPDGAGIRLPEGADVPGGISHLEPGKQTSRGDLRAVFLRTLLWDPAVRLRLDLVPAGFNFLAGGWHVAAPLYDYNDLAFQHGTLEERERTAAIVRDLRVPLYETRALFVRQCAETDALLMAWSDECDGAREVSPETDAHQRLTFHRALWKVKPLILPLPITWIEGKHV